MKIPHISILKKYVGRVFVRNPKVNYMNNEFHITSINSVLVHFKTKFKNKEAMVTVFFLRQLKTGEIVERGKK
jgi:hypothetical protein